MGIWWTGAPWFQGNFLAQEAGDSAGDTLSGTPSGRCRRWNRRIKKWGQPQLFGILSRRDGFYCSQLKRLEYGPFFAHLAASRPGGNYERLRRSGIRWRASHYQRYVLGQSDTLAIPFSGTRSGGVFSALHLLYKLVYFAFGRSAFTSWPFRDSFGWHTAKGGRKRKYKNCSGTCNGQVCRSNYNTYCFNKA